MLKEVVEQDENVLTPRSLKGRLSFLDLVILVNLGGLGASMAVCFMPAPQMACCHAMALGDPLVDIPSGWWFQRNSLLQFLACLG